jgi:nitrate reductase gamma subunit
VNAWLEWARGPAFIFCFSFMVLGLVRHAALVIWETGRVMRRAGDRALPWSALRRATLAWLLPVNAIRTARLYSLTSVAFHVAILVVPVFLAGHVALWRAAFGVGWPAIPNAVADWLTVAAVLAAAGLAVLRVRARATRALTRPSDLLLLLAIAVPFASGFLVLHPALDPLPYEGALLLHVMSANLLFLLVPTTKLAHVVLLPGLQVVSEAGWHWPAEAGSRVGSALGKEAEGV